MRILPACLLTCLTAALASTASAQWSKSFLSNNELSDGAGEEVQVKLVATTEGRTFASWYDSDPSGSPAFGYDVKLQLLDGSGNELWPAGGVVVADRGFSSTQDYGLATFADNAFLAFRDDRFTGTQITVARVDSDGALVWGTNGVQVTSTTAFVASPTIAVADNGTVFVAWTQDSTARVRRLDQNGSTVGAETVLAVGGTNLSPADMQTTSDGGVVLSWISQAGGFFGPRHLYAQKFTGAGAPLWGTSSGLAIEDNGSLQLGNFPPLVADAAGGAYFAWYTVSPLQCFVQHVLANGATGFGPNPIAVSTNATRIRVGPSVSVDPLTGEPYVFWTEQNAGQSQSGLRAQKLDLNGNRLWGAEGLTLISLGTSSVRSVVATAIPGGVRGSWIGGPGFAADTVSSTFVTSAGVPGPSPNPAQVAGQASAKDDLAAVLGPFGDVIVAWNGDESGDNGVHAQNVQPDGSLGPMPGAVVRPFAPNVDSYTATVGQLGGVVQMTVDLSTTGHPFALVLGYTQPANVALPLGPVVLVNIAGGELLSLLPQAGPSAQFTGTIPNDSSLCGLVVYTQAAHFGAGLPLALSNAVNIHVGN